MAHKLHLTRSLAVIRLRRRLEGESFPRIQMGLIVALTGAAGLLCSFLLLRAGVDSIPQQRDNKGTVVEFLGGIVGPHCAECAEISSNTAPLFYRHLSALCSGVDPGSPLTAPLRILPEPYWHVAD